MLVLQYDIKLENALAYFYSTLDTLKCLTDKAHVNKRLH
jgi:hypothetical protein